MSTYIIKQVKPTGKADTGYGVPYYVQFEEDDRIVYAQKKSEPQAGDKWDGEIVSDKYNDWKFKKAPFVPGQTVQNTAGNATTKSYAKPAYKDNSDGMRQGMCINNAANYVNQLGEFSDSEWATKVHAFATALYLLGDLKAQPTPVADTVAEVTEEPVNLDAVKDFFGA